MFESNSKQLHEDFELKIKRELAEGENNKKSAELPKKLFQFIRTLEILFCCYMLYQYLLGSEIPNSLVVISIIWLIINPTRFLYSLWLEHLNNANLNFVNADILKTKNEVLYELDKIRGEKGL